MSDVWTTGDHYEPYVGRWSRLVALDFLDWLDIAPGQLWVDVGCGTGALTSAILDRCEPSEVVGVDPSVGFVSWASAHITDPRARFVLADAGHLPSVTADVVVSGLVLNFVPGPQAALAGMCAVAPSGTIAAYVWDYLGGMEMMRHFWDAAAAIDPAAAELDEGARFPLCHPDALRDLWLGSGLDQVEVRAIDVPTVFRDVDDYWTPFLGGVGVAPAYAASLDEHRREQLRDRLVAALPIESDGTIRLTARAWAVRGTSPA